MNRALYTAVILSLVIISCPVTSETRPAAVKAASLQQNNQPDEDIMANLRGHAGGNDHHAGAILYQQHCAQCHDQRVVGAPHKSFLEMLPADMILKTMNEGVMQQMAKVLIADERKQIAAYLAGNMPDQPAYPLVFCAGNSREFDYNQPAKAAGWGIDRENSRFIAAEIAQLDVHDISRLELKWAFAYPHATRARSQPALAGGAVFVGSQDGTVYSLDANSGCVRWTFRASAEVRTGITVSPWKAGEKPVAPVTGYFADILARVYAVNLESGELLWMRKIDEHPSATVSDQPVLYDKRVYVTVSSLEAIPVVDPNYVCCTFRGSLVALDADTGDVAWKSYTIREEPKRAGTTSAGTAILAPSGAGSWNSPTIDVKRQRLYIGTGNNYSSPAQGSSDAIIAFDISDGNIAWIQQPTAGDAWNSACLPSLPDEFRANCPAENGLDVDFGAPPILFRVKEREILVAGQKSGDVYGINPEDGAIIWQQKPGRGGNQGGIHFGMAGEDEIVFVPIADYDDGMSAIADLRPGISALNAFTGEQLWTTLADNICHGRKACYPGVSAAITAIPGAVFAGHMDGRLRAYAAKTGDVLWDFNSHREFKTLSGETAHGGSFGGGSGPLIADGKVYINSGYGIYFHMPGNVLLVFEVADKQ